MKIKKGKGIVLYSGGLDSLLAAKILMNQGIDIIGYHCILPFVEKDVKTELLPSVQLAKQIDLKLEFYFCDHDYIKMVMDPPHGYGKNMNPCVDCKLFFIKKAAEYMRKINADFVASGEVVGQRPMSQLKHTLNHIEKESGLEGRLIRPLSAKILKPTIPEEEGIIDRDRLYGISGRGRKEQMAMAKEFGIDNYLSPAGGCLFTDPNIALRVKDLFDHHENIDQLDFFLMTIGRHYRINDTVKLIVGRNENENRILEKYIDKADYFLMPEFPGPNCFLKGIPLDGEIELIVSIISRYSKKETNGRICLIGKGKKLDYLNKNIPITDNHLKNMRI